MSTLAATSSQEGGRLQKELGLFDVFSVSTGAMFSSGFFLLPGLAFAMTGPAVVLAYLLAGLLILPAMFSKAELSTALPRAGGTYYFLDRSLGPLVGTVGGLGTYLALTLKTAFALIGIGAYAAFFVDLPIKPVAIGLTIAFVVINMLGAKETTALQRWLVIVLLSVLALFTVQGLVFLSGQPIETTKLRLDPFFTFGTAGLLSTVGFVFVSYAGLTKVASVAEEVRNPDRNIPLGMMLSLGVTTFVYGAGVFLVVAIVDPATLHNDLTPIATASETIFGWLPARLGLGLIVIAALAAFASTGNAGLLSASRYPLAMSRDRLLPPVFASIGRFRTPVPAILATGGLMVGCILLLDAAGIAKLASAFQLFIFILVNFAVIVMRESRIASYDPGYRSPFYPWTQIFGIVSSIALIAYMGWMAVLFTLVVVLLCLAWYFVYARSRVRRHGAIYHWFKRLGQRQFDGLDREFRGIMKEKGLRSEDPFDQIVARSFVIDVQEPMSFEEVIDLASARLAERIPKSRSEICDRFLQGTLVGHTPVMGTAMPHFRTVAIEQAEIVLVRARHPVPVPADDPLTPEIESDQDVRAVFFLVSPEDDPAQHLRILAQIAGRVDEGEFRRRVERGFDAQALREVLLRDERYMALSVSPDGPSAVLTGTAIRDVDLPGDCLVAVIARGGATITPSGDTVIESGDRLTIIGEPDGIELLRGRYGHAGADTLAPIAAALAFDGAPAAFDGAPAALDDAPAAPRRGWTAPSAVDPPEGSRPEGEREPVDPAAFERCLVDIAHRSFQRGESRRVLACLEALGRIRNGAYGNCDDCGGMIPTPWLRLRPEASRCLECMNGPSRA